MRQFTFADVDTMRGQIVVNPCELIESPLWFHRAGLSETSSGYGAKLTTAYKIHFCGRLYRLYSTCYGNAASVWFKTCGQKIFVE